MEYLFVTLKEAVTFLTPPSPKLAPIIPHPLLNVESEDDFTQLYMYINFNVLHHVDLLNVAYLNVCCCGYYEI